MAFGLFAAVNANAQLVDICTEIDGSDISVNLTSNGVTYNSEIWNSLTFTLKFPTGSGVSLGDEFHTDNYSLFGGALSGNSYQASGFGPTLQSTTSDGGYDYYNYTFVSTNAMMSEYLVSGLPTGVGSDLPADTPITILEVPVTAGDPATVVLAENDDWTEANNISYNTIIAGVDQTGEICAGAPTGPFVFYVAAGGTGAMDGSSADDAAATIGAVAGGSAAGDTIRVISGVVVETADLTIPADVVVHALDGTTVDMGTNNIINNGHMTVEATSGLVQGTGSTVSGTGTFEIVRESVGVTSAFNYLTSPIDQIDVQTVFGGSNVVYFDLANQGNGTFGWTYQTTGNLVNARGYAVNGSANGGFNGKRHHIGTVNNGDISIALDGTLYGGLYDGFNLIGNPYPSNIDMVSFITDNVDVGAAIVYDQSAGMYLSFSLVNAAGLDIASGQGFMVNYIGAGGSADFTNSQRGNGAGTILRTSAIATSVLTLNNADGSNYPTYVAFTEAGSDDMDLNYDAKLIPSANDVTVFTLLGDEHEAIQAFAPLTGEKTVALGYESTLGLHTLAMTQFENFSDDVTVTLIDHETGIAHDILNEEYAFISSTEGVNVDRFELVYARTGLNVGEFENDAMNITYQNDAIYITGLTTDNVQSVRLTDITGKQIGQWSDVQASSGVATVNVAEHPVATYLVEVVTNNGSRSQKINITK